MTLKDIARPIVNQLVDRLFDAETAAAIKAAAHGLEAAAGILLSHQEGAITTAEGEAHLGKLLARIDRDDKKWDDIADNFPSGDD